MKFNRSKSSLALLLTLLFLGAGFLIISIFASSGAVLAAGPTNLPGAGSGALAADALGNLGVGAAPSSSAKFLIQAPDALSTNYAFSVIKQNGAPIMQAANDGTVTMPGLVAAGLTMNATNVSAGQFGANTGNGNFSFPASVGIGTATPSQALTVIGGGLFTTPANNNFITSQTTAVSNGIAGFQISNSSAAWLLQIQGNSNNELVFSTGGANAARFNTNGFLSVGGSVGLGGSAMSVNGGLAVGGTYYTLAAPTDGAIIKGSVGIGTTAPTSTLTVAGEIKTTSGGFRFPDGTLQTTAGGGAGQWTTTSTGIFYNGGRVGIGTASPQNDLQIGDQTSLSTATPKTLSLGGTFSSVAGSNAKFKLYDTAGGVYGMGVSASQMDFMIPAASGYNWYINGIEKVRIATSGNMGIGTAAPAAKLDVAGIVNLMDDGVHDAPLQVGYTATAPAGYYAVYAP
jgi:hypothetical protein